MKDTDILYYDLEQHGSQGSWDWEADLRFAQAIGDKEAVKDLQWIIDNAGGVVPVLISFHRKLAKPVQQRRLRALRQLIDQGKVKARWFGTGEYGKTQFGVNRVRHYELAS